MASVSVVLAEREAFKYAYDLLENPSAIANILVNPDAVYGFPRARNSNVLECLPNMTGQIRRWLSRRKRTVSNIT